MLEETEETPVYGIEELAELGGVNRRTIRFYVQRGLLPPPTGTGRGKHYTQRHLTRLVQVREWQEGGVSLDDIKRRLDGDAPLDAAVAEVRAQAATPWGERWLRVVVADGVELHVRGDGEQRAARLASLLRAVLEREDHRGEDGA